MTDTSKSYINGLLADATYKNMVASMGQDKIIEALQERMTPESRRFNGRRKGKCHKTMPFAELPRNLSRSGEHEVSNNYLRHNASIWLQ